MQLHIYEYVTLKLHDVNRLNFLQMHKLLQSIHYLSEYLSTKRHLLNESWNILKFQGEWIPYLVK